MAGEISANIFEKCLPAISTDIDRCGAATLCNISPTTEDELASIYKDATGRWRIMGSLLESDFMGMACGIKRNGLYDLLAANRKFWSPKRLTLRSLKRDLWTVEPFIMMKRKGPRNSLYWTATGTDGAGTAPNGAAYDAYFDVASQHSLPADVRWFGIGWPAFIRGVSAQGSTTQTRWVIVDRAVSGSAVRIYVTAQNAGSILPAVKKTFPTTGLLTLGVPNVSAYERHCSQIPGLNTNQLSPMWIQETRYSICDNELYRKYIDAIKANNPLFKEFGDIEAVELNAQIIEDFQRRMVETWFFNPPISTSQNLTNWDELDEIVAYSDDANGNYLNLPFEGRCIGRRANAVGYYEQMAECGRVFDLQGQVLNIPELISLLYNIYRTRKTNGTPTDVIELWTSTNYLPNLTKGFFRYIDAQTEGRLTYNLEMGKEFKQGPFGLIFTEFRLQYPQITVRIVTSEAFDDLMDAHTTASSTLTESGRIIWIPDFGSSYQAILDSWSVTNTTGTAQEIARVNSDYQCIAKVPKESTRLIGTVFTTVVECADGQAWLENIDGGIPEHVQAVGSAVDYYGDYTG